MTSERFRLLDRIWRIKVSAMAEPLRPLSSPAANPHLSSLEARCMKGYYALRERLPAPEIGAEEVRHWLRKVDGMDCAPADATVLKALLKTGVPHRSRGRPKGGRARLDMEAPPFPSARQQAGRG